MKIAIASFGRGMADFVCPWRATPCRAEEDELSCGIGKYFAAVGGHMWRAVEQYAKQHPEVASNAV